MKKLILSMNTTRDGFMAGPEGDISWHFPFWDEEMLAAWGKELDHADTILLGRRTYQALAEYWSTRQYDSAIARDDLAIAEMMNTYRKVVASKTLGTLSWANSVTINEIPQQVAELKLAPGKDIVVFGSTLLTDLLIEHDLVDRYVLWEHPVCIQKGRRLFRIGRFPKNLTLVDVALLRSGVIKRSYERQ